MAEKKSILEEALLDIKNIQSALNANTKEILRSVAKEEIDSVVKESLMKNEADYDVEDLDSTEDDNLGLDGADDAPAGLDAMGLGDEESDEDEDELDGFEDSEEVVPAMAPELGMGSDDELSRVYDRTGASDDDVMAIYKKLNGEDEIEIVGDEIHLNITEPGEYIVKKGALGLGDDTEDDIEDIDLGAIGDEEDLDLGDDEEEDHEDDSDERDFEIEIGDEDEDEEGDEEDESEEDEEEENEKPEEEEEEEEELDEAIRKTKAEGNKVGAKYQPKVGGARVDESTSKKLVLETTKKYNNLLTEAKKLQSENHEFRNALKTFRNQLVETVVFNSNLTYVTRLFMEHSTTKAEKQDIIKRFDVEVSNLVESKKLYKTIANNLESRKPMNESVEGKLIKGVTTSTSKQLNESTAYVDPSTKRILDLINRVENK
jgi:hypothetical protein